jgi:hypothetical protein
LIIDDLAPAERPAWTQWEAAESRKPDLRKKDIYAQLRGEKRN